MKKFSSLMLTFIMLISIVTALPVVTEAAGLPKSSVTSIVVFPCGFTANFKKQKKITGYQMQYSTSKKFNTKSTKTIRTTKTSSPIRKLGSSKRYYVRVRTYKKSGKKYTYSAWSTSKPVTTLNKNCPDPAHVKSLKGGNKMFTAATYKSANASGYQIRYSTKSNLSKAKTVTLNGKNKTTITVKGLKAGTKYYVQSRTFRKVKGKTYYSYWSPSAKSVTTQKAAAKKPSTSSKIHVLTKSDVEWVQNQANQYILSRGIKLDDRARCYSFETATNNFQTKEELLKAIKHTIDWQYQECVDNDWKNIAMYVKFGPGYEGKGYFIYVMFESLMD